MYKISIYNNGQETVVHYPDPEAPKIINPKLNPRRSQAGSTSFILYPNNPGYNLITRFVTKVIVTDVRDGREIFRGRVYTSTKGMSDGGLLSKDVICEGEMNYLHDTRAGSVIYEDKTPQEVITEFLNAHNNSGIEDYKKVYPGIINVEDWLFFTSDFETTLEAIQKYVYNENKGVLQFRRESGVNYLDYVSNPSEDKVINVTLGENLKSLSVDDSSIFGTRIIPVGANGLTIENVNDGKNYLEDSVAVSKYGIIYQKVDYSDIEDDEQLKTECQADLSQYTQPTGSLDISALDLSTLANTSIDSIDTATSVHIKCPILGVDDIYKVTEMEVDLSQPWNPTLTLSNKPTELESSINDIQSNNITRTAVYGGVQLGYRYGIRVVSHDNSVEILINGKEGIIIKNDSKQVFYLDVDGNVNMVDGYIRLTRGDITINIDPQVGIEIKKSNTQIFYIDTSGNLIMDGIQKITRNGNVIIENTFNAYGGLNNIYDINGNLVLKLGVEAGTSDNTGATLIGYNKDSNKPRFRLGIAKDGDFGVLQLLNSDGAVKVVANADDNNGNGVVFIVDSYGISRRLATEDFVLEHMSTGGGA
ncbi:phage tail protein [Clostridium kluyveri]|uniref:phage tail protein n=1 Tax=Clostridium kluyveri TaxID=1534 RepID=UPI002246DF0F|nr:phage tail protein [Clostridium kluyveri]UZQ50608.1 phage tail protein [Clostridium kluyveri]UZQ51582.1 phage tail protein [Clostridium kluyveri]